MKEYLNNSYSQELSPNFLIRVVHGLRPNSAGCSVIVILSEPARSVERLRKVRPRSTTRVTRLRAWTPWFLTKDGTQWRSSTKNHKAIFIFYNYVSFCTFFLRCNYCKNILKISFSRYQKSELILRVAL